MRTVNAKPSLERVRELLDYNPETGQFVWRVSRSGNARAGSIAGGINGDGYLIISIDDRPQKAHRLAWLSVYGVWPTNPLDHINRVKSDNRICNLREVTVTENTQNRSAFRNNKTGFKGVHFDKTSALYRAQIRHMGKLHRLGRFKTPEEAFAAYQQAAAILHTHNQEGGFAVSNREGSDNQV